MSNRRQHNTHTDPQITATNKQGTIVSLRESFGFIQCAYPTPNNSDLFFHFSNCVDLASLKEGGEVEFDVGLRRQGEAAFHVRILPPGATIEWEVPIAYDGDDEGENKGEVIRWTGFIVKSAGGSSSRFAKAHALAASQQHGQMRVLTASEGDGGDRDDDHDDSKSTQSTSNGERNKNRGKVVKYYAQSNDDKELRKGDFVEFTLVLEIRTELTVAKDIKLLLSERERLKNEREEMMLQNATIDRGKVVKLCEDYGFIKSLNQKCDVFFSFSYLEVPEGADNILLENGQDLEYLVVSDDKSGGGRGRQSGESLSARQIKFLPKGTVEFYRIVKESVEGQILVLPRCRTPHNAEKSGIVRLRHPITLDDGKEVIDVLFSAKNAPGGIQPATRENDSRFWVKKGDILCFDVEQDVTNGSFRMTGTACALNGDKRVRLVSPCLLGRTEGVVHALKIERNGFGYGFIRCADGNSSNVYFRTEDLFPEQLQADLCGSSIPTPNTVVNSEPDEPQDVPLQAEDADKDNKKDQEEIRLSEVKLAMNTAVSLDISLKVHEGKRKPFAHRILPLPGPVLMEKVLITGVKGVISKESSKRNMWTVELEEEILPMANDERYPYFVKILESVGDFSDEIVFPDTVSAREKQDILAMAEARGLRAVLEKLDPDSKKGGIVKVSVKKEVGAPTAVEENETSTQPDDASGEENADGVTVESTNVDPSTSGKAKDQSGSKQNSELKPTKTIQIDHKAFSIKNGKRFVLGLQDVIVCDVVQRRTGKILAKNAKIVERKSKDIEEEIDETENESTDGVGFVAEIVSTRNFGFIHHHIEEIDTREKLFFHFKDLLDAENSNATGRRRKKSFDLNIHKGDEVKFEICVKNGKRNAIKVVRLPSGTIKVAPRVDNNPCQGFILIEPSHTTLSNLGSRSRPFYSSNTSEVGEGRWKNVGKEKAGKFESTKEDGIILLTFDPAMLYAASNRRTYKKAVNESTDKSIEDVSPKVHDSAQENVETIATDSGSGEIVVADDEPSLDAVSSEVNTAQEVEIRSAIGTHVSYKESALSSKMLRDSRETPRRGDLVSFSKGKGSFGKEIRLIKKAAATTVRGHLEGISLNEGIASFIFEESKEKKEISLASIVSCSAELLKEGEKVEGLLCNDNLCGVSRIRDVYLESKVSSSSKAERPRLNLGIKQGHVGGKATYALAKGPDDTIGFAQGWSKRKSLYEIEEEEAEEVTEESSTGKTVVTGNETD